MFVPRTNEEMLAALDWWFLNHPYPDKPFYEETLKGMTTPRNVYAAMRNSPVISKEFCDLMMLAARAVGKDPLEMIRNAPYDKPYQK